MKQLNFEQVRQSIDPAKLNFSTTEEIKPLETIIEQDVPISALKLGVAIKSKNYNIFVSGNPGTGRATALRKLFKHVTHKEPVPDDICYVFNFINPYNPIYLFFPAGMAKKFKKTLHETINELRLAIPKRYNDKEFQGKLEQIVSEGVQKENNFFIKLSEQAKEHDFVVKSTKEGMATIPIYQDRVLSNKDYDELPQEIKHEIEENRKKINPYIQEFIAQSREIELNTHKKILQLQKKLVDQVVLPKIERLKKEFGISEKINSYLDAVFENISDNVEKFLPVDYNPEIAIKMKKQEFHEFNVNILVDNSKQKGSPAIFEKNPSFPNLIGKIEKIMVQGSYITDFTLIRPGSIIQANGGYLVVNAMDLFSKPYAWNALKSVVRNDELAIEDMGEQLGYPTTTSLKPEAIPIRIKVIIIGNEQIYQLLYKHDEDFRKLFQVKAEFDDEITLNKKNLNMLSRFVTTIIKKETLLHLTSSGFALIVEYLMRKIDNQKKFLLKFNDIANLLLESNYFALQKNKKLIDEESINLAIAKRKERASRIPEKIYEQIEQESVLINLKGSKTGQINGLAVYQIGDLMFGKPTKITAQVFAGKDGIISIDREAKMSGKIFNKASFIITSYLRKLLQKNIPLSLSIAIAFEQSYGGIDGDSASAAEIFAILSAVGDIPIYQNIAVTGSCDQTGKIQPIGGVNEKIEGFFEVCKRKKYKGTPGVIIPKTNVRNLMLSHEIVEAVKNEKFKIFAISTIAEGMEIISGKKFDDKTKSGAYKKGTVLKMCQDSLNMYEEKSKQSKRKSKGKK